MPERHAVTRFRHELQRRVLTVTSVERLTPNMVRITLAGDDLAGFTSAGHDDHVKLFFPAPDQTEPAFRPGPGETPSPDALPPSPMRDFTPRRFYAATNELVVDFALHEAGPATEWAANARPGAMLGVGGPRGSAVVTDDFDWYLLVGDETALPAIGRRLEELRPAAKAIVVAAVTGPEEELALSSRADLAVHWVHRPSACAADPAPLLDAVAALTLPEGDGYAWIAGESGTAKAIRNHLIVERGHHKGWIKAAGYWLAGNISVHDRHDD